jgi:hypothetical protein
MSSPLRNYKTAITGATCGLRPTQLGSQARSFNYLAYTGFLRVDSLGGLVNFDLFSSRPHVENR